MSIRLLIVDDHDLVRDGLRMTFDGTDIEVVAEASDGQEAFEQLQQHAVDVALVDIRMPRADGFRFLQLLRDAGLKLPGVLMHSVDDGMKAVRHCQQLGAMGLVLKGQESSKLLNAVRSVFRGQQLWKGCDCPSDAERAGP